MNNKVFLECFISELNFEKNLENIKASEEEVFNTHIRFAKRLEEITPTLISDLQNIGFSVNEIVKKYEN